MAGKNPTAVNISIGLDHEPLQNGIKASRKEIAAFVAETRKLATDEEKYLKSVRRAQKMHDAGQLHADPAMSASILQSRIDKLKQYYGIETELERKEKEHAAELFNAYENLQRIKKNSKEMELRSQEEKRDKQHTEALREQAKQEKMLEQAVQNIKTKREQDLAIIYKRAELMRQAGYSEQEVKRSAENTAREMGIITKEGRKQLDAEERKKAQMEFRKNAMSRLISDEERSLRLLNRQDAFLKSQGVSENIIADARERYAKTLGFVTERSKREAEDQKKKAENIKFQKESLARIVTLEEEIARKLERQDAFLKSRGASQRQRDIARERYAKELGVRGETESTKPTGVEKRRLADLTAVRSMVEQTKDAQQRYNEKLETLERVYARNLISEKKRLAVLKLLKEELKQNQENEDKKGKSTKGGFITGSLGQFGSGLLAGFGVASLGSMAGSIGNTIGQAVADSIKLAMERQRIFAATEALLGSEKAASKLTAAMRDLDKASMLTFGEISKAGQTMLGFGVSTDLVMPSLNALSQISMGNAERFQSLSLAFGQVAASGKLAGQEILQMVNAGFNPLQEISRTTGISMSELRVMTEQGKVSFAMIADAMLTATEAGGRYADMNKKMLDTPAGMLAKLKSDMEVIKADLGEQLMPTVIMFFESLKDNEPALRGLADGLTYLFDSIAIYHAANQDFANFLFAMGDGKELAKWSKSKKEAEKVGERWAERDLRRAKLDAERLAREKQKQDDLNLSPAERKKRVAAEQQRLDEERAQKDRAKRIAETEKEIQDLQDVTERNKYFREIGGHNAKKTAADLKEIADAMAKFDKKEGMKEAAKKAKDIQDEISKLQEESNKLKKTELELLLIKNGLDKQNLTAQEQQQKSALMKAFLQAEKDKFIDQGKKMEVSRDPTRKAQQEAETLLDMLYANLGPAGNQNNGGLTADSFASEMDKLAKEILDAQTGKKEADVTTKAIAAGSADQRIMVAKMNEQNKRAAELKNIQVDMRNYLQQIAQQRGINPAIIPVP